MKVLSISSDRKIFEEKSAVRKRMLDFVGLVDELVIIVFSKKSDHLEEFHDGHLRVIPTNSTSRFLYPFDGAKIGRKIEDFDIVTTQDPFESGLAGVLIKLMRQKPLQVQAHTDFINKYFILSSPLNFFRFLISLPVLYFANRVRVVSERIKKSIEKIYKNKPIDVLPIYTEVERPKEGVFVDLHKKYPEFDFIVLSASRLESEKNIPLLLESFKMALEIIPETGLVIVGSGKFERKLKEKVKQLGLEEKVRFEGWKENLIPYYKSADLFVSTSDFEGYGATFVEASYNNCPILATDVGIMNDVLVDNEGALICPVGDKECLAHKMAEARRFYDVRDRIKKEAKKAIMKHIMSKEVYLKKYLKLWKETK